MRLRFIGEWEAEQISANISARWEEDRIFAYHKSISFKRSIG